MLARIAATPGVTLVVLEHGRPASTVRANLGFLEESGLVVRGIAADRSKPCRLTDYGNRILGLGVDPVAWRALSRTTPLGIAQAVAEHRGLTTNDLAARFGLHRVVINVHIRRLLAAGLLTAQRDENTRRYTPTGLCRTILAALDPASVKAASR